MNMSTEHADDEQPDLHERQAEAGDGRRTGDADRPVAARAEEAQSPAASAISASLRSSGRGSMRRETNQKNEPEMPSSPPDRISAAKPADSTWPVAVVPSRCRSDRREPAEHRDDEEDPRFDLHVSSLPLLAARARPLRFGVERVVVVA